VGDAKGRLNHSLPSYVQFINAHGDTKYVILWMEEGGQFVGNRV